MTVTIISMYRPAGIDSLGGFNYLCDVDGVNVELSYQTYQSEQQIIDDAIASQIKPIEVPAINQEKEILGRLFAGLDANKPADLMQAVAIFKGIMSGN